MTDDESKRENDGDTPDEEKGGEPSVRRDPPYATDRETLERECEVTFLKGSGPGGQHRNKRETAVRVVHLPSGVSITAQERRSQSQNREAAFERLVERLEELNRVPKKRKKTRKPRSADRKRLEEKKKRSDVKRQRRSSGGNWD